MSREELEWMIVFPEVFGLFSAFHTCKLDNIQPSRSYLRHVVDI